jgi:chemotaxis protein MotB
LSDKVPSQKGPHEGTHESRAATSATGGAPDSSAGKAAPGAAKKETSSAQDAKKKGKKKSEDDTDLQLFADPFGNLDKLAAKLVLAESRGDGKEKGTSDPAPPGGDLLRDPYEPASRPKRKTEGPAAGRGPSTEPAEATKSPAHDGTAAPTGPATTPAAKAETAKKAPTEGKEEPQETAKKMEKAILDAVAALGVAHPMLSVTATSEGILIDLTDNVSFSMFAVGSAEPRPELVVVMARIGAILQSQQGQVVLRGHTDGRPYRTAAYDNWRLSSARAQMASYMLIRGGLNEARVDRIEGHADRSLKIPGDKVAAQNRRIEILLKVPPS